VVGGRECRPYVLASNPLAHAPETWVAYTYDEAVVSNIAVNAINADADPSPDESVTE